MKRSEIFRKRSEQFKNEFRQNKERAKELFNISKQRQEGFFLNGEKVDLDTVLTGRFRGAGLKCWQYKVIDDSEFEYTECCILSFPEGSMFMPNDTVSDWIKKERFNFNFSEMPDAAYGNWV